MKKILFAAFVATLLSAGCQKTEVIGLENAQSGPAMSFSTEMKKITKAGEVTGPLADAPGKDDNLHAQGFSIWAYADYDLTNATNVDKVPTSPSYLIYDGMKDWFVEYVEADASAGTTAKWNPHKEFYWPGTDKNLRFYAVSAARTASSNTAELSKLKYTVTINHGINSDEQTQTVGEGTNNDNDGDEQQVTYPMTIEDFVVTDDGNEDLMVADFIKQNQDQNSKTVSLKFHHTLSKVQFVFTTTTTETDPAKQPKVYVQKIVLKDLLYKGDLNVTSTAKTSATQTTAEVEEVGFVWAPTEDKKHFEAVSTATSIEVPTNGSIEYLTGSDAYNSASGLQLDHSLADGKKFATWLMLPQDISTKQVEITYVINTRQFKAIFPLKYDTLVRWIENQFIRYKVNLSPNLITFTASSTDWTKFDGDGDENVDEDELGDDDAHGENNPDHDDDIVMNN